VGKIQNSFVYQQKYKLQWLHFTCEVDKFINHMACRLFGILCTKNYENRFVFEEIKVLPLSKNMV